jgi:protein-S-isoprenylcysteine O-methyltransferase Ste14
MPYASTATGAAIFTAVMLVFLAQEFTQGFDTPDSSSVRDDRWALVYLEVVPVLVTIQDEHDLVTSGPYRLVRHPMYTGSAIAFLGVGLALGTWPGLLLVFFGTLAAMVRRISVEERALTQALGEEYASYAADRSRMLPGVW